VDLARHDVQLARPSVALERGLEAPGIAEEGVARSDIGEEWR
jgi:hypothetical protein